MTKYSFVDPWLAVCDRCPLPDCVRHEGEICNDNTFVAERLKPCPVYRAYRRGWTPAEALARAEELGLRQPVIWLEM
jgi:hypothetical protein